jgi:hypothetical protein
MLLIGPASDEVVCVTGARQPGFQADPGTATHPWIVAPSGEHGGDTVTLRSVSPGRPRPPQAPSGAPCLPAAPARASTRGPPSPAPAAAHPAGARRGARRARGTSGRGGCRCRRRGRPAPRRGVTCGRGPGGAPGGRAGGGGWAIKSLRNPERTSPRRHFQGTLHTLPGRFRPHVPP